MKSDKVPQALKEHPFDLRLCSLKERRFGFL